MSFLDKVRTALAAPAVVSGQVKFLSPTDDVNHLWPIVSPDWIPSTGTTRAAAMAVPAVKRARGIICTTVARIPLRAYRGDAPESTQPLWLDRTNGPMSPYHRMVWTVDDLLFYGWSCWAVQRSTAGQVIAADRVPFDQWRTENGQVIYAAPDGREIVADPKTVLLIPGSDGGLLEDSATAVRHASDLLNSAAKAARNPAAYLELHQTNERPVTKAEVADLIADWSAARNGVNGGVAFTSNGIQVIEHGTYDKHLLVEGRNAAALDIARAMSLPGSTIDATVDKASLNYETAESRTRDLIDYGLASFMSPIAARLGLDDVVPRGVSIRFDLDGETGPRATEGTPDDGGGSTAAPAPTEQGV